MDHNIPRHRLLTIAVVSFLLFVIAMSFLGCSSPTAPTTTRRLAWSAAPGCTPNQPLPKRRTQEPLVAIQVPGDLLRATWLNSDGSTLTVNFQQQVSGIYMLCDWRIGGSQ